MSIFGKGKGGPTTGSGDGGTTGTPSHDLKEEPPGSSESNMVVSGGGVADTSEDDAAAQGDRGLG